MSHHHSGLCPTSGECRSSSVSSLQSFELLTDQLPMLRIVGKDFNQANFKKIMSNFHQHTDCTKRGLNILDHCYMPFKNVQHRASISIQCVLHTRLCCSTSTLRLAMHALAYTWEHYRTVTNINTFGEKWKAFAQPKLHLQLPFLFSYNALPSGAPPTCLYHG